MPELNDLNADSPAKLSRRNVVVGTAWAVPAIMVVGASPAFAITKASVSVTVAVTARGGTPSQWDVTFTFAISGTAKHDRVTIDAFGDGFVVPTTPASVALPQSSAKLSAGDTTATITVRTTTPPSDPTKSYTVTYSATSLASQTKSFQY